MHRAGPARSRSPAPTASGRSCAAPEGSAHVQERATSQAILEHPWLTAQAPVPAAEPATVSHQTASDILAIITRARNRRATSQGQGPATQPSY